MVTALLPAILAQRRNTDQHADADADRFTNLYSYSHTYRNQHADTDIYANTYRHGHRNTDSNTNSHCDAVRQRQSARHQQLHICRRICHRNRAQLPPV